MTVVCCNGKEHVLVSEAAEKSDADRDGCGR